MYMLDTNILVFSMRHPHTACAQRLASHLGRDICISVITYAELEYGILNSSRPVENRIAVEKVIAGIPVLDFGLSAAAHFGDILASLKKSGKDRQNQDRDKMIAAHARSMGAILVTDNLKDFLDINDLRLENWREPGDLSAFQNGMKEQPSAKE